MSTTVALKPGWKGWTPVYALGLYTITAYGTWAYGFGVMIDAISADTGWSTSFLGTVYGAAMALTGLSAFWSGRLLDRFGPTVPLGLHAIVASGLMLAALSAESPWVFGPLFALGAGLAGSTGFYSMTTVMAARSRADRPDRAIAVLTLVGAFSSPIYLPLAAWLLTRWDWRSVGRALVLAGVVGAVQAAGIVRRYYQADADRLTTVQPSVRSLDALARALTRPAIRRALLVYFLAGAAAGSMWVYQVPIMTGAGMSLALAGTLSGLRGFCQLFGRMGLTAAVERYGSARLLQVAYLVTAVGSTALLLAGLDRVSFGSSSVIVLAVVFALLAGAGFGASSPLQAIHARSHFDAGDLGLLMGLQGAVLGLAGAVGPMGGAFLRDFSGAWTLTVAVVVVILVISARLLESDARGTHR